MSYTPYSEHEVVNGHIIFKKIQHDECPSNPLEDCDAMGSIFSFSTRHGNHINQEQVEEYVEEYGEDAVFLSYFEHGNCLWGVKGTMSGMPDFRWDGVGTAGLWIPDDCLLEEAKNMEKGSPERVAKMEEWAGQACTVYTQWCNGEAYGVCVKAYKAKYSESGDLYDQEDDYRYEEEVYDESCWGMFGYDYAEEFLTDEFLAGAKEQIGEAVPA